MCKCILFPLQVVVLYCLVHSVLPEMLLIQYPEKYMADFRQTNVNHTPWNRYENFTFWSQKVKGQGHRGFVEFCKEHCVGGVIKYSMLLEFLVL